MKTKHTKIRVEPTTVTIYKCRRNGSIIPNISVTVPNKLEIETKYKLNWKYCLVVYNY